MERNGRESGVVRLLIGGDLYVNRPDPTSIMAHLAETLRAADISLINQEVPLSDRGSPWAMKPSLKLKSPTASVQALTAAGVNVVTLATNHGLDYGYEALADCLSTLDAAGIAHAGAGANVGDAHRPAILERNGTRVAILNYTSVVTPGFEATDTRPGLSVVRVTTTYALPRRAVEMPGCPADLTMTPNAEDVARLDADIQAARAQADVVVAMWHWGVSGTTTPSGLYQHLVRYQVDLAHRAIEQGADLVVGAGPHVLQGVEVYQGKVICYSLGEVGFDLETHKNYVPSALLEVTIQDRRIEQVALLPIRGQGDGTFAAVSGPDALPVHVEMQRLAEPLGTTLAADGDRLLVETRVLAAVA